MKATGGKTPSVNESPFFDDAEEDPTANMTESCTRNDQQALKAACFKRDGYRCVVTGLMDTNHKSKLSQEQQESVGHGDAPTNALHIIPFALGHWENEAEVSFYIIF